MNTLLILLILIDFTEAQIKKKPCYKGCNIGEGCINANRRRRVLICSKCIEGYYQPRFNKDQLLCIRCTAGKYTTNIGANTCIGELCSIGKFANKPNQKKCNICPQALKIPVNQIGCKISYP